MKKQELLDLLIMANKAEEEMVANVANHLDAALEWFKGTPEELEILKTGLKRLEKESIQHSKTLDALRKKILKEGKNVY